MAVYRTPIGTDQGGQAYLALEQADHPVMPRQNVTP